VLNILDRAIGWFSPANGLRRANARMRLSQARRYEGAALGRRTDTWRAFGASANSEIGSSLQRLRDRHRDLVRNNPWVARAVQAIVSNTVGYGITAKFAGTDKAKKLWTAWAESTDCDADGRHDIYGLQALIMRGIAESGEILIRRRWRKEADGFAVPMQLQVLESDYLDLTKTFAGPGTGWTIQGVQFNAFGQREGI
jgi:capsid protein